MGLLTWVMAGILVLAILGLGWKTFFSGVTKGAQIVANSPVLKNATEEAKQYIANATKNATKDIVKGIVGNP